MDAASEMMIKDMLDMCDGKMSEDEFNSKYPPTPFIDPEHGKCVDVRHELYHNVYTYEDGFEEWDSIGD